LVGQPILRSLGVVGHFVFKGNAGVRTFKIKALELGWSCHVKVVKSGRTFHIKGLSSGNP
jgi:hypothetical protein